MANTSLLVTIKEANERTLAQMSAAVGRLAEVERRLGAEPVDAPETPETPEPPAGNEPGPIIRTQLDAMAAQAVFLSDAVERLSANL